MGRKEDVIKNIEALIIDNRLKEALDKLIPIFSETDDEEMLNGAILTLSRLNDFMTKSSLGVVDHFDKEYAQIRLSILNLKSAAKKAIQSNGKPTPAKKEEKTFVKPRFLFEDKFSNNQNQWPVGSSNVSHRNIENGKYILEHLRKEHCDLYTRRTVIDTEKDFTISSRMAFVEGTESNGYGLCWGKGDNSNYFQFAISANGHVLYNYFHNNDYMKVSDWILSSAVKTGAQYNLLEIQKRGNTLHFKLNNQEVYTAPFLPFFGDELGFVVNKDMKIAVDFIRVEN